MIIIVGVLIVFGSVLGGFMMAGGNLASLWHVSEFVIIGGAAFGALVIMSPKRVIIDLFKRSLGALKGSTLRSRRVRGVVQGALRVVHAGTSEWHDRPGRTRPETPRQQHFFQVPQVPEQPSRRGVPVQRLAPIVDGKIKPDQLKLLLDIEMESIEMEEHEPVSVLTKCADAMPGFGIVAAVMGIVITMGAIAGPIEEIGHKVAAALVGTFLGIFISYGLLNPMAVNIEFFNHAA